MKGKYITTQLRITCLAGSRRVTKQLIWLMIFSMIMCKPGYSQFGGLLNKAKNKISQRIDRKTDAAMEQTLDKAEGKTPVPASPGNTPASDPSGAGREEDRFRSFSKYDFVPGGKTLYAEDFSQDSVGELPLGWNSSGSGELVRLDKYPGQWLRLHQSLAYLSSNQRNFGADYTVEFDLILQLKNNGWMYPEIHFGMLATRDTLTGGNEFLKEYQKYASVTAIISPGENNSSRVRLSSYLENKGYFLGDAAHIGALQNWWGTPVHIAIQVQKERLRLWVNELKAFDIPKAIPAGDTMNQLRFQVGGTNYPENAYGVFIGNIKVAAGLPDTRHKLLEEGKFSTSGILFDLQSAVIRPESNGVIKEIAAVLKDNPSIRIKIIGHTSSDGNDAANMELSQKRAAAVKEQLVSAWGIADTRIGTGGKGETEPVADNKTPEGRAQNRRVEFIKQ